MTLFLRSKKIFQNQILLSKLSYIDQIYTIPKYFKKEIERIYDFLWSGKKIPPKHLAQLSIWIGGLDSKFIKSPQCSLQRSYAVSIEHNTEF